MQPDVARASVSVPDAHDWITRSRSLSGLALFANGNKSLSGDGEPVRVSTQRMSAGALRVLGLPPLLGREFSEDEDKVGGPAVTMLGERFWRKQYVGRPDIVGSTIRLDGIDHTVLGVVREQPHWLGDSDVWVPLQNDPAQLPRGTHFMNAIGRLAPGVTVASAEKDLLSVVKEISRENPEYQHHGILVIPWVDELLGEARSSLGALGAVVGLVLLIACVNLANLLLARGAARRREVAVRMALGANRWRVARALLAEAAVLSVAGTALGLLLGWAGASVLRGALPIRAPALAHGVGLDARVLAFSVGLCVLTTALFGVLPSLLLARGNLSAVRGEMRSALGHRTQWLQSGLVVFEVALALAPLLGAALVLQSVQRLLHQDPGFRPEQAIAFRVQLPVERYRDEGSKRATVSSFLTRHPGVAGSEPRRGHQRPAPQRQQLQRQLLHRGTGLRQGARAGHRVPLRLGGLHRGDGHPAQGGPDLRGDGPRGQREGRAGQRRGRPPLLGREVTNRGPHPTRRWRGQRAVAAHRRRHRRRPPQRPRREAEAGDVLPARPGNLLPADLRPPQPTGARAARLRRAARAGRGRSRACRCST